MSKITSLVSSPSIFNRTIIEIYIDDKYIGYIHEENPNKPGVLYFVAQNNLGAKNEDYSFSGVELSELIIFFQTLRQKETMIRDEANDNVKNIALLNNILNPIDKSDVGK
jgi:hypothetical protein